MSKEYNTYVVIGLQWGDEGKGKILHRLCEDADYVVKYQGSYNSGHSIIKDNKKITLNTLPLGITNVKGKCIIAAGAIIDLDKLFDEVELVENNFKFINNLYIDGRANIIMPYHILKDNNVSNIVNCYFDKISNNSIRAVDLNDMEIFSSKLVNILKNKTDKYIDFEYIYSKYSNFSNRLNGIIIDTIGELNKAVDSGKKIIFESSESAMLDLTLGTYPDVFIENTISSNISNGSGVAFNKIKNVIGVFKSYITRVGDGIFPTEVFGQEYNHFRDVGNEYIAQFGAARRCGWLDLAMLKYSSIINGVTELHMTKLDVLTGLEKIKLAIAYEIDKKVYDMYPMNYNDNNDINILYKEFDGWEEDISKIVDYEDLPDNCKRYIEYIEGYLGVKITLISVGPNPDQTIFR